MFLGCSRTRIKAPLLSLDNNMNGPAVLFLWGLCAAGGREVGPGEGPRTLGSDGGVAGDDPADVKRCHSHQDPSLWFQGGRSRGS